MTAAATAGDLGLFGRVARFARRIIDAIVAGFVVVLLGAGAVVAAIAAFALAAFMALGVAAMWIVARVFGPRRARPAQSRAAEPAADVGEGPVLVAERGAHGWSVEGTGDKK